jgi:hypothetical protein
MKYYIVSSSPSDHTYPETICKQLKLKHKVRIVTDHNAVRFLSKRMLALQNKIDKATDSYFDIVVEVQANPWQFLLLATKMQDTGDTYRIMNSKIKVVARGEDVR